MPVHVSSQTKIQRLGVCDYLVVLRALNHPCSIQRPKQASTHPNRHAWRRLWMAILGILLVAALGMDTWTRVGVNAILPFGEWTQASPTLNGILQNVERPSQAGNGHRQTATPCALRHTDDSRHRLETLGNCIGHMDVGVAVTIQSDSVAFLMPTHRVGRCMERCVEARGHRHLCMGRHPRPTGQPAD